MRPRPAHDQLFEIRVKAATIEAVSTRIYLILVHLWCYFGRTIHLIGSHVIDPLADGRLRCRSYAAYLGLDRAGVPLLNSYGAYDDGWAPDEGSGGSPTVRPSSTAARLYQIAQ